MKNTQIMGIVNVTPDSYYDGGRYFSYEAAFEEGINKWKEGADILDVGGESSRPGASPVSESDEIQRVIPVIQELSKKISIPISIDTSKPAVAALALNAGASCINDITGFYQPAMCELAASHSVDICVMHMQGNPQTMQINPYYEEGIVPHLLQWFEQKIEFLLKYGVKNEQIILDPGIGFGKTIAHNLEIIQNLSFIKNMGFRVLVGLSRKAFMSKILNKPAAELLPSTIAMNTVVVMSGVDIIRVHDVNEHKAALTVLQQLG